MKNPKYYWHIHHGLLVEPVIDSIMTRRQYIREDKPKDERKLRLKLLKPVRGKLPDDLVAAGIDCVRVGKSYTSEWIFYKAMLHDNMPAIKRLHAKECPNCPWRNGTIFPE